MCVLLPPLIIPPMELKGLLRSSGNCHHNFVRFHPAGYRIVGVPRGCFYYRGPYWRSQLLFLLWAIHHCHLYHHYYTVRNYCTQTIIYYDYYSLYYYQGLCYCCYCCLFLSVSEHKQPWQMVTHHWASFCLRFRCFCCVCVVVFFMFFITIVSKWFGVR